MANDIPIEFTELTNLIDNYSISPSNIDFKSCSLSNSYVSIKEDSSMAIVPLSGHDTSIIKKNMSADNIIMHPTGLIIALRSGPTMQVYDLSSKQRLANYAIPNPNEMILFWKWLTPDVIAFVTSINLYIWDIKSSANPQLVTSKNQVLNSCQIINITANKELSWFAINGIFQENGKIAGKIQLFSKGRNISQIIDGHVSNFATLKLPGAVSPSTVFIIGNRNTATNAGNMHVIEIDHNPQNPAYSKKNIDIYFPEDAASDFPISCQVSSTYGIIYILTKYGFIHLFDLETGLNLFVNRISADPLFTASSHGTDGILTINKKGQVLSVEINKNTIIPYILGKLSNVPLALSLASRGNLPGAENLFAQQFESLLNSGDYAGAAKIAASSSQLRTPQTIDRLKNIQAAPGQVSPILQYFSILLDNDKLNKYESIELGKPVLQQNKQQLFENWLNQDKITYSEELGDIVKPFDAKLALRIYLGSSNNGENSTPSINNKIIICLAELNQFDKIIPFCEKVNYSPNYLVLIQMISRSAPDKAVEFANQLINNPNTAKELDLEKVSDIFFGANLIEQGTAFLLEGLKDDQPSQGHLQTRLLEINLLHAPQVAEAILSNNMFSHYDKPAVAKLCEKQGLYQKALENYTDLKDIKRCVVHTEVLPADWLVSFFGQLNVEQSLECLKEFLKAKDAVKLQIVIQVSTKFSELIGSATLIKMFEEFKNTEGLYYYLSSIVNTTEEENVVFKYIQAAASLQQYKEIERIVKDNNHYNGEKVKNFLKEAKLPDQLPLIIVCDRFNFVHDLVLYLYKNQFFKFIEVYVQQVNPSRTPEVIAALLDVDCDENIIKNLLSTVLGQVPLDKLVEQVESRNRLKILLPFMEASLAQGSKDPVLYNTLAKIYIDSNNNPEKFLTENEIYDTLEVGRYCEKRDPYLAYICYSKGNNDEELINITNENSMFKYQARFLLKRSDLDLYNKVLSDENMYRRELIDQIVGTAIPELADPEPISVVVKAFMDNNLPVELIELLEKIILEPDAVFSNNPSLQGLLILTAIKAEPSKVTGYIEKLDKFDPIEMGSLCTENGLHEEAFQIYDKFEMYSDAMRVIVEDIMSLDRGEDYANKKDSPELWYQLGGAQLNGLRINESIDSYIKSGNPGNFDEVIDVAEHAGKFEELIPYLKMCRTTLREAKIDGELILCYAELNKLNDIELFLKNDSNAADLDAVGDKLFTQLKNYPAAKILFENVSNYSKLATTLVYLGDYQGAVECARKASNIKVWKQVNAACINNKEFTLAQICGLNLIIDADELQELVDEYESNGYFEQLIVLFESSMGLERAHMGMFTELAILYAKYDPSKLMDHLRLFWSRLNIPKVLKAAESFHLWNELVFLYSHYDEWDNAILTMIDKAADTFDHAEFKKIVVKVSNLEIYYKAITFYLNMHPNLITDLLTVLTPRIDISRVVRIFLKSDNLPMIKPFLISVLDKNLMVVNDAYHELLIEEKDYKTLQACVDAHDRFDALSLANRLENHELIFFRRIAAFLYRKQKKFGKAISILKTDKLWREMIETSVISGSTNITHDLLRYFVEVGNRECFIGLLFEAYHLIDYDYVMELVWLNTVPADYVKPYEISIKKEQTDKINELFKDLKERQEKEKSGDEDTMASGNQLLLTNGTGMGLGNGF